MFHQHIKFTSSTIILSRTTNVYAEPRSENTNYNIFGHSYHFVLTVEPGQISLFLQVNSVCSNCLSAVLGTAVRSSNICISWCCPQSWTVPTHLWLTTICCCSGEISLTDKFCSQSFSDSDLFLVSDGQTDLSPQLFSPDPNWVFNPLKYLYINHCSEFRITLVF